MIHPNNDSSPTSTRLEEHLAIYKSKHARLVEKRTNIQTQLANVDQELTEVGTRIYSIEILLEQDLTPIDVTSVNDD